MLDINITLNDSRKVFRGITVLDILQIYVIFFYLLSLFIIFKISHIEDTKPENIVINIDSVTWGI